MWGREEAYTGFLWGNPRKRDRLGESGVDGRIIFSWSFMVYDAGLWTGSSWPRIGTGDGHL
jgi:hypothetical protein